MSPVRGELHPGDGVRVARHLRQHRVLPRVPDLEIVVDTGRDHLTGVSIELNRSDLGENHLVLYKDHFSISLT